jgi:hypothetical protein
MFKYLFLYLLILHGSLLANDGDYGFYENRALAQSIRNNCIFINNFENNRFYIQVNDCNTTPDVGELKVRFFTENGTITFMNIPINNIKSIKQNMQSSDMLTSYIQWEKEFVERQIGAKITFKTSFHDNLLISYYYSPKEFNKYIGLDEKKYIVLIVAKYTHNQIFALSTYIEPKDKEQTIVSLVDILKNITFYKEGKELANIIKNFNKKISN